MVTEEVNSPNAAIRETSQLILTIDQIRRYEQDGQISYPERQRDFVWDNERKYALIDSIIKRYPLGLFMWERQVERDADGEEILEYSVVDGQQRLRTILDYINHRGSWVNPSLSVLAELRNRGYPFTPYQDLSQAAQRRFFRYQIPVSEISNFSEEEIDEIFLRVQYGMALKPGEKIKSITSDLKPIIIEIAGAELFHTDWGIKLSKRGGNVMLSACFVQAAVVKNPFQRFEFKYIEPFLKASHQPSDIRAANEPVKSLLRLCGLVMGVAVSDPVVRKLTSGPKLFKLLFAAIYRLEQNSFVLRGCEPDMAQGLITYANLAQGQQTPGEESAEYLAWMGTLRSSRMDTDDAFKCTGMLANCLVNAGGLEVRDSQRFFSKEQRRQILERAEGRCQCQDCVFHSEGPACGTSLLPINYHADHIRPWIDQGLTSLENGQALCSGCNSRKGATNNLVIDRSG